jgi:choline-sulfatase
MKLQTVMQRFLVFLSALLCLPCLPWSAHAATRPNILFIIVDDQSPLDFKLYNPRSTLRTPNIDRLAAQGMVLDRAYHMGSFMSAVCVPSRHMIKTGRTLWHLPIAPEAAKHCPPDVLQHTIAAVFNRAGYDTMRTGKRGTSYEDANKLFTVRRDAPGQTGTEPGGTAWHGQQVLDYLDERAAAQDRDPFLIYFGFSHPHDPRNAREEFLANYGAVNHDDPATLPPASAKQPPLPVNYLPAHPFPTTLLPDQRDETKVSGVWTNRDERTICNEIGREFACAEDIDTQIGRVLKKLEAMGELENTWIFYASDHGIAIGRHGLQGKQNLYEPSWRVPFIVKGPSVRPGTRAPGNIYLLDVLATLCDIAGIPAPPTNEGLSFRPVLEGRRQTVRDVLYGVHGGGTKPGMRCVRKGDWKLIKYDGNGGTVRETQLFNLAENPHELLREHHDPRVIALTGHKPEPHQVNLAGDPRHAAKLAELEALLLAEMRRLHDPYRLWNQPDDGLQPPPEPVPPAKKGKQ